LFIPQDVLALSSYKGQEKCCDREIFVYNDLQLNKFCFDNFSMQMPLNFHICQLPEEISSWVYSTVVLQLLCSTKKSIPLPHPEPEAGQDGVGNWASSVWDQKYSSIVFPSQFSEPWDAATFSPSPNPSAEETLMEVIYHGYLEEASKKPQGTWVKNSSVRIRTAPFTSMTSHTYLPPNLKTYASLGTTTTHCQNEV
jgi:hypothetical protein